MQTLSPKTKQGECDACGKTGEVFPTHHGMWMCPECRDKELAAVARSKEATEIVEKARKIDFAIEVKQDIFVATTVPYVELTAAIANDDSIPADQKEYALVKECAARVDKLTAVIFADEAALMAKKNERYMWLTQTQTLAGKLRTDLRAQFQKYDISYVSKPPTKKEKTTKPVKPSKPGFTKAAKEALYEAAKKYDVPAAQVQSIVTQRSGISYDAAAKELAGLLGKL